mgnify:CR=1 FL=1
MPCRPSAPIFGQRSRGNWLLRSISAARGAISLLRKVVNGLADRVRGLAEIEVEHPLRVGNHGRAASGKLTAMLRTALFLANAACHGPKRLGRSAGRTSASMRPNAPNSPLPWRAATGCNRVKTSPRRPCPGGEQSGEPHARNHRTRRGRPARGRARTSLFDAAGRISIPAIPSCSGPIRSGRISTGCARKTPVHYCKDSMFGPYWSVTKYNDIMDIETNHAVFSSAASLGGITIRDVAPGSAPRKLHRHGPAAPWRAAQDRGADVHADPSRPARDQHPQALGRVPRQSAEERGVRLGRSGSRSN